MPAEFSKLACRDCKYGRVQGQWKNDAPWYSAICSHAEIVNYFKKKLGDIPLKEVVVEDMESCKKYVKAYKRY